MNTTYELAEASKFFEKKSEWTIETIDGQYCFVCHTLKLATYGFRALNILMDYKDSIRFDEKCVELMKERYNLAYEPDSKQMKAVDPVNTLIISKESIASGKPICKVIPHTKVGIHMLGRALFEYIIIVSYKHINKILELEGNEINNIQRQVNKEVEAIKAQQP